MRLHGVGLELRGVRFWDWLSGRARLAPCRYPSEQFRVTYQLFDRLVLFDGPAMLIGMLLGRFLRVMCRMESMAVSDMGMVRRFLMIAGFMMFGGFAMMNGSVFVVFCRFLVVCCAGMCTHRFRLSKD